MFLSIILIFIKQSERFFIIENSNITQQNWVVLFVYFVVLGFRKTQNIPIFPEILSYQ